jgi:AcrR family transcriptional regulator
MERETASASSRGDSTREALIRAAIEVFGRDGFGAASTRAIAEAAGVNQALIGYHFGGKPGLYSAALRHIADGVQRRLNPMLDAIEGALATTTHGAGGDDAAASVLPLLHQLTDALVTMLCSDESASWARLILREQQNPSEAFDVLYRGFMGRVIRTVRRLIARATNADADSQDTRLSALTVLGQALVFRAAGAAVMRQMGWTQFGADEISDVQDRLRRNVTAMLEQEAQ